MEKDDLQLEEDYGVCAICGCDLDRTNRNPWPVVLDKDARCCPKCDEEVVLPERFRVLG